MVGKYIELIEISEDGDVKSSYLEDGDSSSSESDYFSENESVRQVEEQSNLCFNFFDLGILAFNELRSTWKKSSVGRKCAYYRAHIGNNFFNQVDLMLEMMPTWARFLSQYKAYGHYAFLSIYSDDLAIYLNICSEETDTLILEKEIKQLFESFGCRIVNMNIRVLDIEERQEPYHIQYLHHPLDNQRYQMFLLGLENRTNWSIYQSSVDDWEVDHFIVRYLKTHLSMCFDQVSDTARIISSEELEPWSYVFQPFKNLGILLPNVRDYYIRALGNVSSSRIGLVEQLLLQTFNVDEIDEEETKNGLWLKTFCLE